eukprot:CAMPEP_0170275874 /NCGR_PEP_ID=MMETSP0116_2-20130129/37921_1 /TAXON_ID=400756 /ORGANISM="Durinskia baltica, Strain CSIRO CS-38" /LENGTH=514 /DNA_ID=CAMNT_0010527145 /DNA_START=108 /DNA_END=1648 /DNA_ORIENTATION=+
MAIPPCQRDKPSLHVAVLSLLVLSTVAHRITPRSFATDPWIIADAELAAKLQPRWEALCTELGVESSSQRKWWDIIVRRHSETRRSYHTLAHLEELFLHIDAFEALVDDKVAVSLTVFFHDIVYNPRAGSPKNERRSAGLFCSFSQEAWPPEKRNGIAIGDLVAKVQRWIMQTATHKTTLYDDDDCKLFMDLDMAILGSDPKRYARYAQQIRNEYIHVPEAMYCKARASFLRSAMDECLPDGRPGYIFATSIFRQSHEQQARENMEREVAQLSERLRNCGSKSCGMGVGAAGAIGIAAAATSSRSLCATTAHAGVAVGVVAFGLRLAFGARFVRHPYPEPPRDDGNVVVLAGSYNPPHFGHLEMLRYLSKAHAKVVAVIGVNPRKTYHVSAYQRQEILATMIEHLGIRNVDVVVWAGFIFQYARSVGATAMYRGIRTWTQDGFGEKLLEFENLFIQPVFGNWPIPTAYLQGDPKLSAVSSTLIRRRIAAGETISDLVPEACVPAVQKAYAATPG